MQQKPVNWNTLIITVVFGVLGWASKEIYKEARNTHDDVLILKLQMLPRTEFDVQMSAIRTRLSAVELDIEKLKDKKP